MGLIAFLISLFVLGLVVGALGRLALPGPDPMGIGMTIAIGLAGSFIGGVLTSLIAGRDAWGFLVALARAARVVYVVPRSRGGTPTAPRPRARRLSLLGGV